MRFNCSRRCPTSLSAAINTSYILLCHPASPAICSWGVSSSTALRLPLLLTLSEPQRHPLPLVFHSQSKPSTTSPYTGSLSIAFQSATSSSTRSLFDSSKLSATLLSVRLTTLTCLPLGPSVYPGRLGAGPFPDRISFTRSLRRTMNKLRTSA